MGTRFRVGLGLMMSSTFRLLDHQRKDAIGVSAAKWVSVDAQEGPRHMLADHHPSLIMHLRRRLETFGAQ